MPGEGIFQPPLQRRIEALEGEPGGDVLGLAPPPRNDARRQHRSERRHPLERTVGMPELVRLVFQGEPVIFRHYVALLVEGLEDHEVGAVAIRTHLGDLERAEAAREGKLRFIGDVLVAKDQNRVLIERRAHRRVCGLACRNVVDVHSAQFRGKARTQRHDFHRRPPSHSRFEHDSPPKTSPRQASWLTRARILVKLRKLVPLVRRAQDRSAR